MNEMQKGVIHWLTHGEPGLSSKTIAMWLAFGEKLEHGRHYPRDVNDLDLCLRLLAHAPELRDEFHKMADLSREWSALITHWTKLEDLFLDEVGLGKTRAKAGPKTYLLMQSIISTAKEKA